MFNVLTIEFNYKYRALSLWFTLVSATCILLALSASLYRSISTDNSLLFDKPSAAAQLKSEQETPLKPKNLPENDLSIIVDQHIFGKHMKESVQQDEESAPQTRLKLTLIGTFTESETTENSSALISKDDGTSYRFYTGDEISPGVKLHNIYNNRVTLDRDGTVEVLYFEHSKPKSRSKSPSSIRARLHSERQNREQKNLLAAPDDDKAKKLDALRALNQQQHLGQ